MKKSVLTVIFTAIFISSINAQSSCPVVENSSFRFISNNYNPNSKKITFNYYNPTNGHKSIVAVVKVNNSVVINDVIDASGHKNQERSYTSSSFTAQDLSTVTVEITPYTSSNGSGSSCYALRSVGGAPLPVTFGSFTATRNNSTVSLKWETMVESNNRGFSVERYNNDNDTWEEVSFVPSLSSDGNSSTKLTYQYNDNNNSKDLTQYRIKQTDIDGKSTYTKICAVEGDNQTAKTIVFPNPSSNGIVNVVYPDVTTRNIVLFDMTGRVIKQWNSFSNTTLQIDNLTPGIYNLRTTTQQDNVGSVERIVVASH